MPTIEPRITFTPAPATGPLLRELAVLTGKTPARFVRELLDEMAPHMPAMIEAMRVVNERPKQAIQALQGMAAQVGYELAQQQLDLNRMASKRPGRKPRKDVSAPATGSKGRGAAKT